VTKTKIDWADMTWNPVTGCLHDCEYCYARKITQRFSKKETDHKNRVIDKPIMERRIYCDDFPQAFPFGFSPTFHRYRLDEPTKIKKPQNIFVCSMADLFGEWVPDEWIKAVFDACKKAPQHRYLFLTKNTKRYTQDPIYEMKMGRGVMDYWFGTTVCNQEEYDYKANRLPLYSYCFLSIEPIQSRIDLDFMGGIKWVIIGAETGNRKGKVIPKLEWIENIVNYCREKNVPVFMKNSLRDIWKEPLVQEYPWKEAI